MITRYGIYEGSVDPHQQDAFDKVMSERVAPALARLPGIHEVRILKGLAPAGILPTYYQLIELTFPDELALYAAMRSEERRAIGAIQAPSLDLFRGRTPHANFSVVTRIAGDGA